MIIAFGFVDDRVVIGGMGDSELGGELGASQCNGMVGSQFVMRDRGEKQTDER